jgi:biopolymer transport protein ExbD
MRIRRTYRSDARIPTASTADIAFLLIVFFMATTMFRVERGLTVVLPRAETGVKAPRPMAVHVYVDGEGRISIDDQVVPLDTVASVLSQKLSENTDLIVGLTVDESVRYELVDAVIEQLKAANALNATFKVQPKPGAAAS